MFIYFHIINYMYTKRNTGNKVEVQDLQPWGVRQRILHITTGLNNKNATVEWWLIFTEINRRCTNLHLREFGTKIFQKEVYCREESIADELN